MNKILMAVTALLTMVTTSSAFADYERYQRAVNKPYVLEPEEIRPHKHHRHGKRGKRVPVIAVKPIRKRVHHHDRYDCRSYDKPRVIRKSSKDEMLIGGLLGGVLGNQVVDNEHRTGATIIGALIGAAIGHEVGNGRRVVGVDRYNDCGDTGKKWKHTGDYRVTYRFKGEKRRARLSYDPGNYLRVDRHGDPVRL